MKVLKGFADKGKSTMRRYMSFKPHLFRNEKVEKHHRISERYAHKCGATCLYCHCCVNNLLMNLLGATGAYCFFAVKPKVNFDYKAPKSSG